MVKNENYLVLDADDQIKELYKRGAELYKILVKEFGDSILNEKGNISKGKLRRTIYFSDENREKLNSLTHPLILKNMVNIAKNSDADVVFLQIPLLNESIDRLEKLIDIDEVWNITASDEVRFKRLMERKGMTEEIAHRIMEIQSEFENENYDILTVENNGNFEDLKNKLDLFFKNSCINEEKKSGFFGRLKKNKKESETDKIEENLDDKNDDTGAFRKITEEEVVLEKIEDIDSKKEISEEQNLDNSKIIDEQRQPIFFQEQNTENIDLENLDNQDSLDMKKTKLTDLSSVRDDIKEDDTNSVKSEIANSNEEFFEESVEEEKKDEVKKKKKMKVWKKVLITIVTIVIICKALFLGAVYYGGQNYPVNYIEEIQKYSNEYGVDPKVVLAIMRVESNFKSDAVSKVNAKGLMQVLPDTAKHVAKLLNVDANSLDLNDPETNVKVGTYYLKYLMQNFSNM